MNMATFKPFLLLVSLLALGEIGEYVRSQTPSVLYLHVKTMSLVNAGTTSNVSITLGDEEGNTLTIPNLVDWNRYPDRVPFQTGQLDNFDGLVNRTAFASQPCSIDITITGTGSCHAWGLDYVNINSTVPVIGPFNFDIKDWLYLDNQYHASKYGCPRPEEGIITGSTKASLAI